jgi:hypothetical protein
MWLVSPTLRAALADRFHSIRNRGEFLKGLGREIDAPYELLRQICKDSVLGNREPSPELEPLVDYLLKHYEAEYENADDLFEQGLVSKIHLGKLFRPDQLVIAQDKKTGISRVGVLDRWYPTRSEGMMLEGWCWQYDGSCLVKTAWAKDVTVQPEQSIPIQDLTIFPLEYLSDDERINLKDRGGKFWETRMGVCMEFSGWDASMSTFHVSLIIINYVSTLIAEQDQSRVIVDIEPHRDTHKPNRYHIEPFARRNPDVNYNSDVDTVESIDVLSSNELQTETLMMLPPTTMAFDLQKKRWSMWKSRSSPSFGRFG